ncbi:hypothetical protein ASF70_18760 [Rhizobium sp. Leaf321]|uniref:hypothetical protein n=1 Tax=Rhizobium sp. Leaf321 TaxID=1736335 RepID=UPI0007158AE8|nr:hypothetical protein [Rhizobium sp. Leaf321]KQQ70890.1 hypothetical protein ASF70_18760 [Rhizobium sp. Leaf321]
MTKYFVAEVGSSVGHLNDLLNVMCELQFGLAQGETDPRVESLLWIARDLSNGINDKIEEGYAKLEAQS